MPPDRYPGDVNEVAGQTGRPALRRAVADPRAFDELYRRESEAMLLFFTRRTWDAEAAVDLTAETFARAYAGRDRFRGTTDEEERGFLYGIARRTLWRFYDKGKAEQRAVKRLAVQVPTLAPDDIAEIEERAGLDVLRADVRAALKALPAGRGEAVRLRVVDELSYAEIARRLDISEDNARARVSRGLKALATTLEAHR